MTRTWHALLLAAALQGCSDAPSAPVLQGANYVAADALFSSDNLWVGADGAYSIDLGGERVLWLFGDTLIAKTPGSRKDAFFIRNSVAVQTGYDPTRAFIEFFWRQGDGSPRSFLVEKGDRWYWPSHGAMVDGTLLTFYEVVRTPSDCDAPEWCFEGAGYAAFTVNNHEASPRDWAYEPALLPAESTGDLQLGEAVIVEGDWVYVYGTRGDAHEIVLARFARERAAQGDLRAPEWYSGDRGFTHSGPALGLVRFGAPEFSVHYSAATGGYLMVQSEGFGATTLAARGAPRPEGPWSAPRDFLRPPESFDADAHVYAAKAHPELSADGLLVTYVPGDLYLPRFVKAVVP
ncbi:MAG: DUF4185 domain-containing protein [Polyangiaceae bacterium]